MYISEKIFFHCKHRISLNICRVAGRYTIFQHLREKSVHVKYENTQATKADFIFCYVEKARQFWNFQYSIKHNAGLQYIAEDEKLIGRSRAGYPQLKQSRNRLFAQELGGNYVVRYGDVYIYSNFLEFSREKGGTFLRRLWKRLRKVIYYCFEI